MAVNAPPNTRKRSERPAPRPVDRFAGRALSIVAAPEQRHIRRPTHLEALESEAVHVMREVVATFERPVLLFSGGKDSIVLLRLAEKAFRPTRQIPLRAACCGEGVSPGTLSVRVVAC